ncbi:MAG: hypothetical protein K8I27_07440 [Planctomycetes bacterium]|nr:hypothetical protein [Planctomycetota bacterium]
MATDFDNLIRSSKPAVPPTARDGVLEFIEAHGAVASSLGPLRSFGRVAALVVLALASGAVAALFALNARAPANDLGDLRARADKLDAALPTQSLVADLTREGNRMDAALTELETARYDALCETVVALLEARDAARMNEWRERHIAHVREHHAREADATVSALREEIDLSPEQEAEVRKLLADAGDKAVALIGSYYGEGHGMHGMHDQFASLANETGRELQALLDSQQRERLDGVMIVGSAPEDWAPSGEFRDGTDVDVWMNWMTVSRE